MTEAALSVHDAFCRVLNDHLQSCFVGRPLTPELVGEVQGAVNDAYRQFCARLEVPFVFRAVAYQSGVDRIDVVPMLGEPLKGLPVIFKKRKYPDIQSLADAFNLGELSADDWKVMVDKDSAWLAYVGPIPPRLDDEDAAHFRERANEEASELFQGSGYGDVVAAMKAAGIPAEWS